MVTFIIATILLAKFPPGLSTNRGAQCKVSSPVGTCKSQDSFSSSSRKRGSTARRLNLEVLTLFL